MENLAPPFTLDEMAGNGTARRRLPFQYLSPMTRGQLIDE